VAVPVYASAISLHVIFQRGVWKQETLVSILYLYPITNRAESRGLVSPHPCGSTWVESTIAGKSEDKELVDQNPRLKDLRPKNL